VIERKRSDGTYDIRYDDGDSETRVRESRIRKRESSTMRHSPRNQKFREGDRIEARYGGKERWFRGEITFARSDGTYDIRYDDGDSEKRVRSSLIRMQDGPR
jgi:hypothetical protein